MSTTASIVAVGELLGEQRDKMFELLDLYFSGVTRPSFDADLDEKQWAILLHSPDGAVVGFTTLMTWRERWPQADPDDRREVLVVFSGDTIVAAEHRRERVLMRTWAALAARLIEESGLPGYWFLLCGGYKTYRFLPLFLGEYHPSAGGHSDPALAGLLDACATRKFGDRWDRESGVVRLGDGVALRPGVADIDARRLADPHVRFFVGANPRHHEGDELACIARFEPCNLTRAGRLFHPAGTVR